MAQLQFGGRDDPSLPIYLNPNIYLQRSPTDASAIYPQVNVKTYILASVQNAGEQSVRGATVRFFVCAPVTAPTPGTCQLVGQSNVDLDAGETKEVLCLTPWLPILSGHFCVISEISHPNDASPFTATTPWDINDRHVAQHNLQILPAPLSLKRPHLANILATGLYNESSALVVARLAPAVALTALAKRYSFLQKFDSNVTGKVNMGLMQDFACGDPVPDVNQLKRDAKLALDPNAHASIHAAIQFPAGSQQNAAAMVLVEQLDKTGKVIGGVAVVALGSGLVLLPAIATPLASIPASIPFRPYATMLDTQFMTPDGIFCINFGRQGVNVQPRNDSNSNIAALSMYIESSSDPNIPLNYSQATPPDGRILPRGSFKAVFPLDFSHATPGETELSFVIQQQQGSSSKSTRIIKKVFVLGIDYNETRKVFTINLPQGSLVMKITSVVAPNPIPISQDKKPIYFPVLVKSAELSWTPLPAYSGTHGPLPFEDPWWKVVFAIIFVALLIAGAVRAASTGGEASIGTSGSFSVPDPSISCCSGVEVTVSTSDAQAAALFTAAAVALAIAIASDDADFFDRGRVQTIPTPSRLTVGENVKFEADIEQAPSLGRPFQGSVKWTYERKLDDDSVLTHNAQNTYQNIHYLLTYSVMVDGSQVAPAVYRHNRSKPLLISAKFTGKDNHLLQGPGLYVIAQLWSTKNENVSFELRDDGGVQGSVANTGDYRGEIVVSKLDTADWFLFVFAQDVNTVEEGTSSREAAKTIGGMVLTGQFIMGMNGKPCELNHDAKITLFSG